MDNYVFKLVFTSEVSDMLNSPPGINPNFESKIIRSELSMAKGKSGAIFNRSDALILPTSMICCLCQAGPIRHNIPRRCSNKVVLTDMSSVPVEMSQDVDQRESGSASGVLASGVRRRLAVKQKAAKPHRSLIE